MPDRPSDPRDAAEFLNQTLARLRAVERQVTRLPDDADPLQVFESGSPLGDTRFLDFGAGLLATLIGDNYVRVDAQPSSGTAWDAIVDASLTTSDPDEKLFKGIGEAITYCFSTLGLTGRVNIFIRPGTYTETANITSTPTSVYLFGAPPGEDFAGTATSSVVWALGNFQANFTGGISMQNMRVTFGTHATPFGTNTRLFCDNVAFTLTGVSASLRLGGTSGFAYYTNCTFDGMRILGRMVLMVDSDIGARPETATLADTMFMGRNLSVYGGTSTTTWNLPNFCSIQLGVLANMNRPSIGGGALINLQNAGAGIIDVDVLDGTPWVSLTLSGASQVRCRARGEFFTLTIPACSKGCSVEAFVNSTCDISGPGTIDLTLSDSNVITIRGESLSGHIANHNNAGVSGTFLSLVNADNCMLDVASEATGAGRKAYDLDASSANNVIVFAGRSTYSVAGTDAGTNNRVLPEGSAAFTVNGHTIQDEGISLTQRTNLNFVGAGVTVTDDAINDQTDVTIAGGGGSGDLLVAWLGL